MKIGIMTYWWSQDNYGQLLQCYALQTVLKKMGHKPFLIKYLPQKDIEEYCKQQKDNKCFISKTKTFLGKIKHFLTPGENNIDNQIIDRKFNEFRNFFIAQYEINFSSFKSMQNYNFSDFDAFICGSDQIWATKDWNYVTKAYHLCFASKKHLKLAYAASFGGQQPFLYTFEKRKKALSSFVGISVRENEGIDICNLLGYNATLVCDPTLLCLKEDYSSIMENCNIKNSDKYAFFYMIGWQTEFPINEIKEHCKKENLKIKSVFSQKGDMKNCCNENELEYLQIEEWLKSYENAEIIFTNSFHGTVFAIIFRKRFISFPLVGEMRAMNDRIKTLLAEIGLENRFFSVESQNFAEIVNNDIDWSVVNEKMYIYREKSLDWLKNMLDKK